jgi:NADH-quinone oxidoreductase subunit L
LAGLPFVTAGFYSKGLLIWEVGASAKGNYGLWAIAVFGVLLTSLYTFRVIFLVFFGEAKTSIETVPGNAVIIPVLALSFLSVVGGFINLPVFMGGSSPFTTFTSSVFPPVSERSGISLGEVGSEGWVTLAFIVGLVAAYGLYVKKVSLLRAWTESAVGKTVHQFCFSDWGFDWFYDRAFVRPLVRVARADKLDVIDAFYTGIAAANALFYRVLSSTETGRVRWYAAGVAAGAVLFLGIVLFL